MRLYIYFYIYIYIIMLFINVCSFPLCSYLGGWSSQTASVEIVLNLVDSFVAVLISGDLLIFLIYLVRSLISGSVMLCCIPVNLEFCSLLSLPLVVGTSHLIVPCSNMWWTNGPVITHHSIGRILRRDLLQRYFAKHDLIFGPMGAFLNTIVIWKESHSNNSGRGVITWKSQILIGV